MDDPDQLNYIFDESIRQNAVAQVENVSRPSAGLVENSFHALPDIRGARVEHGWIQIPLYSYLITQACPRPSAKP